MVKTQTAFALGQEPDDISHSHITTKQATALNAILLPHPSSFASCSAPPTLGTPLNSRELRAVEALIAWVSYTQEIREETVSAVLAAQFRSDDIMAIPSALYNEVIEFMLVVKISDILN